MADSYYKSKYGRQFTPGQGLPVISTDLDSVRSYQFEIHFFGLPTEITNVADLTLAAKKVGGIGMSNEFITVDRINDRVFYPGKPRQDELTITFDNLYLRQTASDLWRYFKNIYDPLTGEITKNSQPAVAGRTFKVDRVEIIQLDNTSVPHASVELYGVFPVSWKLSEFNYSTNDFHTIDVNFKYDFLNQFNLR